EFRQFDAQRLVSVTWTYDTTNQPFVPTRGTFVRIAPMRWMRDRASFQSARPPQPFVATTAHIDAAGLDFAALRYWELSAVHSVSAGVLGGWADVDDRQSPRVLPS